MLVLAGCEAARGNRPARNLHHMLCGLFLTLLRTLRNLRNLSQSRRCHCPFHSHLSKRPCHVRCSQSPAPLQMLRNMRNTSLCCHCPVHPHLSAPWPHHSPYPCRAWDPALRRYQPTHLDKRPGSRPLVQAQPLQPPVIRRHPLQTLIDSHALTLMRLLSLPTYHRRQAPKGLAIHRHQQPQALASQTRRVPQ